MSSRDEYVASLKQAFVTLGGKTIFGLLVADFPFLGLPIIRNIAQVYIEKYLNKTANSTEMGVFFFYIDVRVNKQSGEFVAACFNNRAAQLTGSDQEKKSAEETLRIAFNRFAVLTA